MTRPEKDMSGWANGVFNYEFPGAHIKGTMMAADSEALGAFKAALDRLMYETAQRLFPPPENVAAQPCRGCGEGAK